MRYRLASLPFDYRCAVLHDYKRQTYDQIAETMACSASTVKKAVLRYRKRYQDLRAVRSSEEIRNPLSVPGEKQAAS